jgi:hypothetical protein
MATQQTLTGSETMDATYTLIGRTFYIIDGARYESRQFAINRFGLARLLTLPIVMLG